MRRSVAVTALRVDAAGAVAGSRNAAAGVPSPPDPEAPPLPPAPAARPDSGPVRSGPDGAGPRPGPEPREAAVRSDGEAPELKFDRPVGGRPDMPAGPVPRPGSIGSACGAGVDVSTPKAVRAATRWAVPATTATSWAACAPAARTTVGATVSTAGWVGPMTGSTVPPT